MANVIEILLRTKDQTSAPVNKIGSALSGLKGIIAGLSFAELARGAVNAADSVTLLESKLRLVTSGTEELAKVQLQIVNLARQTRTDFGSVGELYARIARSSKQLGATQADILQVTKAVSQAIQISGNTAQEASAGMIQLAQALASGTLRGDELNSVLEQMPRVATAIADGLGTTVGQLRKLGEQGKITSDLVFKSLITQSVKLDAEFKQLRPTIGQTFSVLIGDLKLATAELFKTTGTSDRLTESFGSLSLGVRNLTKSFQLGSAWVSDFLGGLNKALEESDKRIHSFLGVSDELAKRASRQALAGAANLVNPVIGTFLTLSDAAGSAPERNRTRGPTGAQRGRGTQSSGGLLPQVVDIEEFRVTLEKIKDEYGDVLRDLEEQTRSSIERQSSEYIKLRTTLQFLRDEKLISQKVFEERLGAALDDALPEIDLNEIRSKYKSVKKETTELGEFMKGVWQGVGRSIQSTLSDALYDWNVSWKSVVNIARRALADITSAIITSGIKEALKSQTSGGGSSGGSTGSWVTAIASYFGFAAGGGRTDGPTIVGEDGPEMIMGSNRVMNQRQMAFAGSGGINYAPTYNVSVIERDNPEQTKQEIYQTVAVAMAQDKQEFVRQLQRSGYEVRG